MANSEFQSTHASKPAASKPASSSLMHGVWSIAARFAMSGAACFLLNIVIMWLGTEILHRHYLFVFAISWVVTLLLSFFLHRHWTFQATATQFLPQFLRYSSVHAGQIALTFALMTIAVQFFHLVPWKASTLIAATLAIVNFFIHKNWSFAPDKP